MSHFFPAGELIKVQTDSSGIPYEFVWQGQSHKIDGISNHWRIDILWWQERTWRDYFKLYTASRLLVDIYCDLISGEWYLQRLYD